MTVAARFLPNRDGPAQIGEDVSKILNHRTNPLCFGAQSQELLLEVKIQWE